MYRTLPNTGIITEKLDDNTMNRLKSYIKNKKNNASHTLAGNLENSFTIKDKDNWFFNNVLLHLINQYSKKDLEVIIPSTLTKNCSYVLYRFWVNFQNKY